MEANDPWLEEDEFRGPLSDDEDDEDDEDDDEKTAIACFEMSLRMLFTAVPAWKSR